jgi:hypothetical protein
MRDQHRGGAFALHRLAQRATICAACRDRALPVGSSASSTAGRCTNARAIATRCSRRPTAARRCARAREADAARHGPHRARRRRRPPVKGERKRHVLVRRTGTDDVETPATRSRCGSSAQGVSASSVEVAQRHARNDDGASIGTIEPALRFSSVDLPMPDSPRTAGTRRPRVQRTPSSTTRCGARPSACGRRRARSSARSRLITARAHRPPPPRRPNAPSGALLAGIHERD